MAEQVRTDVNITIAGDAEAFKRAIEQAQNSSNAFSRNLAKAAAFAATSWLTLKEGLYESIKAFGEAEQASQQLDAALSLQGLYSAELKNRYDELARETGKLLGVQDDAVKASMALAQGYLGQLAITPELTRAVADLAAGTKIGLDEAFTKVAKTIGTSTNALAKNGIQIDEYQSKQQKLQSVITAIEAVHGGQARAADGVNLAMARMRVASENLAQDLGGVLAPIATRAAVAITGIIEAIRQNESLVKFIAIVGGIAAALVGAVAAFGAAQSALGMLIPAFQAVGGAVSALMAPLTAFVVANPILALVTVSVAAVLLLWKYWDTVWPAMVATFHAFTNNIKDAAIGLKDIIVGALTFDPAQVIRGMEELRNAFKKGFNEIRDEFNKNGPKAPVPDTASTEQALNEINEKNKQFAREREREQAAHGQRMAKIRANETEVMRMQADGGSQALISLKQQENQLLKQLDEDKNAERRAILNAAIEENRTRQQEVFQTDKDQRQIMNEELLAENEDFQKLSDEQKQRFILENSQREAANLITEKNARSALALERLQEDAKAHNTFIKEKERYGATIATIDKVMGSQQVQSAKAIGDELIGLQNSRNATLKAIGKAAAVANITINTAESAIVISKKVIDALPFPINIPVAAALAGARIAYGAEQIASVMAAQTGGLVEGGMVGRDSVPFLLEPGELVVPRKNFEEVVGAVRSDRGVGGMDEVVSELRSLRTDLLASPRNSFVINGDLMADNTFVDFLIRRINERLEFGNAQLVGV